MLTLCFMDDDLKNTAPVFSKIAKQVVLTHLVELTFNSSRYYSRDLDLFLQKHKHLRRLELRNLNLTGERAFTDILQGLAMFEKIEYFRCHQIARNGY